MATRLVHLVDEAAHEDELRLLTLLLGGLPRERVQQLVVVMGRWPRVLSVPSNVAATSIRRPACTAILAALDPRPSGLFRRLRHELVYCWGRVGLWLAARQRDNPVVASIIGYAGHGRGELKWPMGLAPSLAGQQMRIVCLTGTVQRRLVEAGIPMEATVVVRPGVDFGAIRRADGMRVRAELGMPAKGRVLLTASPPSRGGGQYYAVWAAAILYQIWRDVRLVIPGTSREQARLRRFTSAIYCPQIFRFTGDRYSPAELLSASDMLIAPAVDDAPTGWLGWAMAAGVPVIGSAVPAIAELIADGHNGLLCRPGEPHTLAIRIREAFESPDLLARCVAMARDQAYQYFRLQRCVDEHLRLIDDVLARRSPGVLDPY